MEGQQRISGDERSAVAAGEAGDLAQSCLVAATPCSCLFEDECMV